MSEIVACCQLTLQVGALAENRERGAAAIRDAAAEGAGIVVLPELASSGYVFRDADEARSCAERLEGETVRGWAALAREFGIVIVGGMCELEHGSDAVRNSAVLVDPSGLRGVYRKAHLWDRESLCFAPGGDRPPVLDTERGRIAVMVCYDVEFPEWVRLPALAGAELLCVPTNWPYEPRPEGERPAEVVRVQAAASINRLFIAACDRAGRERGVDWVSGTVIVGPGGFPLAGPVCRDRDATILATCDLAQARDKALGERNDVLRDRRPALYGGLVG